LQWVFAALIVVWLAGGLVAFARVARLPAWSERQGIGCLVGTTWTALGFLLLWGFPKLI
jgi:hypothetical protein